MENNEVQAGAEGMAVAAPKVKRARKPKAAKRQEAKVASRKKAGKAKRKGGGELQRGALTLSKQYHRGTSNSGNVSYDSGDKLAQDLRGKALEDVYDIAAKKLGVSVQSLKKQYGKLNPGMQRMNLGNRLRKAIRDRQSGTKKAA